MVKATNSEIKRFHAAAADAMRKVESWPSWKKEGLQFAVVKKPVKESESGNTDFGIQERKV